MAQVRFFVFLAVLCSCSLLGRADNVPPKTEVIDVSPVVPLVVPSESTPADVTDAEKPKPTTISTTSEVPITTPKDPTTAPEAPTTVPEAPTTTKPTTTSTNSTTTKAPTTTSTSTTEAPTTTHAPSPTPKPGPISAPDQGMWMYTDENNVTCIIVQFSAQLNVSFNQNVDNTTRTESKLVNVPANVSLVNVTGNCNGSAQWIALSWSSGVTNSSTMNSMRINFLRNDTTKVYALRSINITVDAKILVNSSTPGDEVKLSYGEAWQTPVGTSYRCTASTQLNLTSESDSGVLAAALVLAGLQEEAYRTTHGKGFSAARECGSADLPDAVPIAVGCALGGLVLVVLVAYLVARHRSAARGYLSM